MLLFLHLNFDKIPQDIPGIKSEITHTLFPKRFGGTDEEFDDAMYSVTGGGTAPEVVTVGDADSDSGTKGA